MKPRAFDPIRALEVLVRRGVRFVVIGGFAGRLWGSNTVTNDVDICYARDDKNVEALAAVLRDLDARLRGAPESVPFRLEAESLRAGDHFTFATDAGSLDCLGTPAGTEGFADLARTATEMDLGTVRVRVAALEDLMRMKRASGRPKDSIELENLAALREEIARDRKA